MKSTQPIKRALAGALLALTAAVVFPLGGGAQASPVRPANLDTSLAGGGEFHPLTPQRIYDSRTIDGGPINEPAPGPKPISFATAAFDINALGQGGIPTDPSKVLAVVVNVTVTNPSSDGVLAAYAAGAQPATLSSLLNFKAGDVVSNLGIVSPGANGQITLALYGGSGRADVVVDVFGWFSTSAEGAGADNGSRLIPVNPGRILDTRDGTNLPGRGIRPLAAGEKITIPVRGVDSVRPTAVDVVPNDPNVVGVVLNVIGITHASPTYLAVTPDQTAGNPTTSNVNLPPNAIKGNLVIVPIGVGDGNVRLFNLNGGTDVAVDVVGYLTKGADPSTVGGRVVPLSSPFRTFDTREAKWGASPLGPGVAESWSFADFAGSVKIDNVPVGAQSAVIGNLTNAALARQFPSVPVPGSYLTAWPAGLNLPRPETSNINTSERPIAVPNMAILRYGVADTVQVFNYAGRADYLFDASAVVLADPVP